MTHFLKRKLTVLTLSALSATAAFAQPIFAQEPREDQTELFDTQNERDEEFARPREGRERGRGGPERDGEMRGRGPGRGGPGGAEMRGGARRGGERMGDGEMGGRRAPDRRPRDGAGRGGALNGDLLQMLSRDIDLTTAQKNQIRPIAETARRQIEALPDNSATQTNRRAQIAEIIESAQTKIRPILTPEQRTQLDAIKANPRSSRAGNLGRFDSGDGAEFGPRPRGGGEFGGRDGGGRGPRAVGPRDGGGRGPRGDRDFDDDERGGPPRRGEFGGRGPRGGDDFDGRGPRRGGDFGGRGPRRGGDDFDNRGPRDFDGDERPPLRREERDFDAPEPLERDEK